MDGENIKAPEDVHQGGVSSSSSPRNISQEMSTEGKENQEETEEIEVEETEISLTESEIEEWIMKLTELKDEKNSIEFDIDNETILKINFEEYSDEEDELKGDEVIE